MTATINASLSSGVVTTADNSGVLQLQTASTAALTIDGSQNVGIGTASPAYKLDVVGSINASVAVRSNSDFIGGGASGSAALYANNTGGIVICRGSSSSNDIEFLTNNAERMRIDSSGNVGIGTSSPIGALDVKSNGTTAIQLRTSTSGSGQTGVLLRLTDSSNSYYANAQYQANQHIFLTGGTEIFRGDSSGRLLVGTGGGIGESATNLFLYNASGASAYAQQIINSYSSGTSYFVEFLKRVSTTNTQIGSIQYNGTNVLYNTTSDARLKKNIIDAPSAIGLVGQIKVRSFDWKDSDVHVDYGVVAQEVFEIAPACVSEGDDGEEVQRTWGVDTSVLVPALVKAIQEQQALIQALTDRITALEGK